MTGGVPLRVPAPKAMYQVPLYSACDARALLMMLPDVALCLERHLDALKRHPSIEAAEAAQRCAAGLLPLLLRVAVALRREGSEGSS